MSDRPWLMPCLVALCWLAATPSVRPRDAVAAPPDSTRYMVDQNGRGVGWFSVSRTTDAQGRFVYRGSGERSGVYKLRRFELVTSQRFEPVRAALRMSRQGQPVEMTVQFGDGKAVAEGKVAGTKLPRQEAKLEGPCFVLPGNVLSAFAALSDFLADKDAATYKGALKAYALPLVIDMEVTGLGSRSVQAGSAQVEVRAFELKLNVPRQRGQQTGRTFTLELHQLPDGRFHGIQIADQGVVTYPFPADARLETPAAAFPEIALRFAAGGDTLAGSLMLPAPDPARPGPCGAVVLVSGSGPTDRDETVAGGFAVFRALAEKLAAGGFASLRYDDRGTEESGGDYSLATMDILAQDAAAAVAALRARPEVDPARIGVVGHSEGAILAPQIAALVEQQSGRAPWCVVMMAGSPRTGREIILEQQDHALQGGGFDPAQIEHKRALQRRVFEYVDGGVGWDAVVALADSTETEFLEMQKNFVDAAWFRSYLNYSAAPWLRRLRAPALVLHGELDTQLPPHHGAALRDSLKAAGHPRVSYVPARGVNHLFQVATTGEVEEYSTLKPEFGTGVAERVVAFLAMCDRLK